MPHLLTLNSPASLSHSTLTSSLSQAFNIHNPRRTRNTKQYTSRHGWIKLDDPSKPPELPEEE